MPNPIPIKIENANITGAGGSITNATITGDATLEQPPTTPPGTGDHPEHPILLPPPLPPGGLHEDAFWVLCFCPNPPPPHWEWILFVPGEDVPEKPHPQPPEPPQQGEGLPEKPFPPDGGWGYKEPWGWIYWPGPGGAGPKKR